MDGIFRLKKVPSACFTGGEFPRGKAGEDPQDYLPQKGHLWNVTAELLKPGQETTGLVLMYKSNFQLKVHGLQEIKIK